MQRWIILILEVHLILNENCIVEQLKYYIIFI